MANFTTSQNVDFVNDLITFTAGAPTFKLVDIVNDGSRANYEQVTSVFDENWQQTSKEISVRHQWMGNIGAYVYDFEYFVDPEGIQNFDVLSLQVEVFAEQPNASLATNQSQTTQTWNNSAQNSAWSTAQSQDSGNTEENLASQNEPLMTFEMPLYQGNNFVGTSKSQTYEGNFVEGRDGEGKFRLSQHTRTVSFKTKRKKVTFAHPYVTDNNQQLAAIYYGNPNYIPSANHPFGTEKDNQQDDYDEVSKGLLGELPALSPVEEASSLGIKSASPSMPGVSDPFKRVDPGDLIALNNIVERISLREARDSILKSRQTMPDARDKRLVKALVAQVVPQNTSPTHGGVLGFAGELETTVHSVHMEVEIPKFLLESRLPQSQDPDVFYVRVTPIVGGRAMKGSTPTPVVFAVSHRSQLSEMLKPLFPPELKLIRLTTDEVIIAARGIDPTTKYITFSARVQRPHGLNAAGGDDAKITVFSDYGMVNQQVAFSADPLSFHNFTLKTSEFTVPAVAPNSLVIRATATAGSGFDLYQGEYAELAVECAESARTPNYIPHVAITAVNFRKYIAITVTNIPDNVIAIRLMRDELDESGSLSDRSKVVPYKDGRKTLSVADSLVYGDYETDNRRRYRYYCVMTIRTPGSSIAYEQVSASDYIVERVKPPVEPPFTPTIAGSNATVVSDNSVGVTVSLAIAPKPDSVNLLITLLEKAGVNQPFVEAVQKQVETPTGFQDLVAFLGTRIDLHTGEHEYLGIIPPGLFVDNRSTQVAANRKQLYAGREYQYVFQLTTRPPQSFLEKVEQFLPGKKVPGDPNLKVTAKKFVNVYSTTFGSLPSTDDLNNQSVSSQFELGYTGITLSQKFSMPELPLKITEVSIDYEDKNKERALLKWRVRGSFNQRKLIDAFRVYVTYRDQTTICGKIDAHPKFTEYSFKETEYAEYVGDKIYFVVPIMLPRGIQGAPSKKVKLSREHTIPEALLLPKLKFDFLGLVDIKEGAMKKVGQTPLILNKNVAGPDVGRSPRKSGFQQSFDLGKPGKAKSATNPKPAPAVGKIKKPKPGPTF